MTELGREYYGIYGKAAHVVQIVFPGDAFYGVVYFVCCLGSKMFDGFQDTDSGTQAEIGLIHHSFVACKGNHAASDFNVARS